MKLKPKSMLNMLCKKNTAFCICVSPRQLSCSFMELINEMTIEDTLLLVINGALLKDTFSVFLKPLFSFIIVLSRNKYKVYYRPGNMI